MSASVSQWLLDTFVFTGLLIGLILLVRRPVARHFGPKLAYALWALPMLRFLMPPIVLPAWLAPSAPESAAPVQPLLVLVTGPETSASQVGGLAGSTTTASIEASMSAMDLLLPVWLGGAAIFLGLRLRDYLRMRESLLEDARPVGNAGKVRLVETPAITAPVAFGVCDKVIALPPDFMGQYDITARDMAIAHELAHHQGNDLLANIAAQPVLALHWFNPLAWWGWRAMRADQEAACDARVIAGRGRSEKATYAQVIAGFAAGENLTLAASMACPVLGEKSIIHRLRSLTMTDISSRRRKIGIAAITTTALALPLTASISYAHPEDGDEAPEAPLPPQAPVAPEVPQAPIPPVPPLAPEAPTIIAVDPDNHHSLVVRQSQDGDSQVVTRVIRRERVSPDGAINEQEFADLMAEVEADLEAAGIASERAAMAFAEAGNVRRDMHRTIVRTNCGDRCNAVAISCDVDEPVV